MVYSVINKTAQVMKSVEYAYQSYRVVFYTDDDNASGYGYNPRVAYWYGSYQECNSLTLPNAYLPKPLFWKAIDGWKPDMSPGSAAWCESYSDNC